MKITQRAILYYIVFLSIVISITFIINSDLIKRIRCWLYSGILFFKTYAFWRCKIIFKKQLKPKFPKQGEFIKNSRFFEKKYKFFLTM
jgi:hypothetical protein